MTSTLRRNGMVVRIPTDLVANVPADFLGGSWSRGHCVKCDAEVWVDQASTQLIIDAGCIPLDYCADCVGMREVTERGARKLGLI